MKWSQRGKKAIREILKQLFLFIISSRMARQRCLCVLGGRETAKTFSLFPCGYQGSKAPPPHQGDKGKEQGKDGARLAYWQVGGAIQVPLGWRGVVLGKDGERWSRRVSLPPAPRAPALVPAGGKRCCLSPSNTTSGFWGWSAAAQRAAASN